MRGDEGAQAIELLGELVGVADEDGARAEVFLVLVLVSMLRFGKLEVSLNGMRRGFGKGVDVHRATIVRILL